MNSWTKLNKNESGQAALEAAIILIAFVVVASVFAFAVLSAGTASTAKGEAAIYSGLEQVQSSMAIKGAVTGQDVGSDEDMDTVTFDLALVSGSDPVNLDTVAKEVVISYRDSTQSSPNLTWTVTWLVEHDSGAADNLLEEGELAEIVANLAGSTPAVTLGVSTPFSLEIKPPTGAVIQIDRTTPADLDLQMELR